MLSQFRFEVYLCLSGFIIFCRVDPVQQVLNLFTQPWASRCKILITTLGSKGSLITFKQKDLEDIANNHITQKCSNFVDADVWRELEVNIAQFKGINTECTSMDGGFTIVR